MCMCFYDNQIIFNYLRLLGETVASHTEAQTFHIDAMAFQTEGLAFHAIPISSKKQKKML